MTKLGRLAESSVAAVLFVSCIFPAKMVWLSSTPYTEEDCTEIADKSPQSSLIAHAMWLMNPVRHRHTLYALAEMQAHVGFFDLMVSVETDNHGGMGEQSQHAVSLL